MHTVRAFGTSNIESFAIQPISRQRSLTDRHNTTYIKVVASLPFHTNMCVMDDVKHKKTKPH